MAAFHRFGTRVREADHEALAQRLQLQLPLRVGVLLGLVEPHDFFVSSFIPVLPAVLSHSSEKAWKAVKLIVWRPYTAGKRCPALSDVNEAGCSCTRT